MSDEPEEVFSSDDPSDLFELEEELAVGSFGAVYRGIYLPENEIVAVKVMQPEDEEAYQDIVVEILIMKELSHPNIIKFYGAYKKDDELLIAMELAAGGAVDTLMEVLGPLEEKVISFITRESLKSLHYLHEKCCIIHRDIKAANILLTEEGEVKLADFGVSARLKSKLQRRRTFTGTPWWMAPEIIPCSRDPKCSYDYRVDIWAIGITCLEMAEATAPMFEIEPMDVLPEIAKRPPPELRSPGDWTPEFVEFLSWCLKKNPNERKNTKALLEHPFLVNCEGNKSDVKHLLQELNKKTRAFQEQQDEDEEEKKDEQKSPRTSTNKKKKDEASTPGSPAPAANLAGGAKAKSEEGSGFAPKSLSNTTRLRPYQPKTEKERQTQGMMLLQQRLMHQQLRALKKHQAYCNKQIEELQKRQGVEMTKMDKKYQEKIQQLEKTKRKTAEKTAKQEEKEKEAIDKKFAASEGKSLKGVVRSGMRSLGLRSTNSPELKPNEQTQSPRPVEPFKRTSSDADGQLQQEMDGRVTNLAEIISLRTRQMQATFLEQIKVMEQQHALEVELCHLKGKTDTHHIEQYTQLLKEQLVAQHKIEADKGIIQRERQVLKDQKEKKKRFIMQKRKEGVSMDRITQLIQVQDQNALQKLAQDNLKREIHIKIRQKEETFDYEEKIMKELHKTQNDHFYADCRLRLQHKMQMALLYEDQTNAIRVFTIELDALLVNLKKQQDEEKSRDSGHAQALQTAHSEQEEYFVAKKEWYKNLLIEENEQRIKENEESKKKISMSNFRLKQAYFFQHTKEQQQQLEKRKKVTSDTEALFEQRKQMLVVHHDKNLALLRHQAKTLTFLIEEPSLVEKMERDLNESHQRELQELHDALEKEKQRLEKEYESRNALMIEHQKQLREELMKEEEEAMSGGLSSSSGSNLTSSSSHSSALSTNE